MSSDISITELRKRFRRESGEYVDALDDVNLSVREGEFLVLLGPSGCGKTTLLRSIAGLENPDTGSIDIGGRTVFSSADGVNLRSEKRDLSMMFQSYALWPHMDVFGNIAYPLRYGQRSKGANRNSRQAVATRVERALELVGISELSSQYPGQMSGGQQQRVALARAIVREDGVILFDEPLSNVDARVRERLRIELLSMHRALGFTAVYVTHDQEEAMLLADTIAVMKLGRVMQIGTPEQVYDRPVDRYVANFVGTANEILGRVVARSAEAVEVKTGHGVLHAAPSSWAADESFSVGDEVCMVVRPERVRLQGDAPSSQNALKGEVTHISFVGPYSEYTIAVKDQVLVARHRDADVRALGPVWVDVLAEDFRLLSP